MIGGWVVEETGLRASTQRRSVSVIAEFLKLDIRDGGHPCGAIVGSFWWFCSSPVFAVDRYKREMANLSAL
jgi:hypothetical protein